MKEKKSDSAAALLEACRIAGSQRKLASQIGVSPSRLNQWISKVKTIPFQYVLQIEKATSGKITRENFLPFIRDVGSNYPINLTDNNSTTQDYLYAQIVIHKSTLNTQQSELHLIRIRLDILEERLELLLAKNKKVLTES